GHPTAAPALVAPHLASGCDLPEHACGGRAHLRQFRGAPAGFLVQRRQYFSIPSGVDVASSSKTDAWALFFTHADVHPARARDGTLPLRKALPGVCDAAVLYSLPKLDRHDGSFHPY